MNMARDGDRPEADQAGIPRRSAAINRLEELSRHDPGGRGLASKAPKGLLEPAAQALLSARRVLIVTGFCVRSAMMGETDGPPGATTLASGLVSLGATVMILTDKYSAPLAVAACRARKPRFPPGKAGPEPGKAPGQYLDVPVTILASDKPEGSCLPIAAAFAPDLVLAVERPGGAADGHRYSMRGAILDDIAPSADPLFTAPSKRGWKTMAIGDGGNELGMGSLRDSCVAAISLGEQIFCAASSDYPVAAGISNWGAYALAGAVSLVSGRMVLPDPEEELAVLEAVYKAGGVDGCTREHSLSVDSLPATEYLRLVHQMYNQVLECL